MIQAKPTSPGSSALHEVLYQLAVKRACGMQDFDSMRIQLQESMLTHVPLQVKQLLWSALNIPPLHLEASIPKPGTLTPNPKP